MGLIREIMLTKKLGHISDTILAGDKKYSVSRTLYLVSRNRKNDSEKQNQRCTDNSHSTYTLTRNPVKKSPQKYLKNPTTFEGLGRPISEHEKLIAEYHAHHPLSKGRSA